MRRRIVAFVRLSRLTFLGGGVLGVALGAAIAHAEGARLDPRQYLLAQAAVTSFQLMTHYANDYFDAEGDAYGTPTAFAGGSGVLPAGDLPPHVALVAALVCAAAGVATVIAWLAVGNVVAAALAFAIGLAAWSYSAPPLRLLATGAGEVLTALVVGTLVPLASSAAFTHTVDARAIAATLPTAAAMFVMMLCVEFPDADADRRCGKRNLVVRFGAAGGRLLLYAGIVAIFGALAFALTLVRGRSPLLVAAMMLIAFDAVGLVQMLRLARGDDPSRDRKLAAAGVRLFSVTALTTAVAYALTSPS